MSSNTTTPHATLSLRSYVSNIYYGAFIQDDDEIAHEVYTKNWSSKVYGVVNGDHLAPAQFRNYLFEARADFDDRYLVSQSTLVVPADASGEAGQVAHTTHWTATSRQQQKKVKGTIVSVLKIGLVDGKRKVETESLVLKTEDL